MRVTNQSLDSCNSCKRLGTSFFIIYTSQTFPFTHRIYPFETYEFLCSCIRVYDTGAAGEAPRWRNWSAAAKTAHRQSAAAKTARRQSRCGADGGPARIVVEIDGRAGRYRRGLNGSGMVAGMVVGMVVGWQRG